MTIMTRKAPAAALMATALLGAACSPASTPPPAPEITLTGQVKAVVDRTKATRETYAVYNWNEMTDDGRPVQEWGAEFHSGDKHRVETPRDRVIADCRAQTGIALHLATNEVVEGPVVARGACGISTARPFVAAEGLGSVTTPLGAADRVRLADKNNIRTYDISPAGVILRATYAKNTPDKPLVLSSEAVAVLGQLPAPDIFDRASLYKSFVPDRFKTAPGETQAATSPVKNDPAAK